MRGQKTTTLFICVDYRYHPYISQIKIIRTKYGQIPQKNGTSPLTCHESRIKESTDHGLSEKMNENVTAHFSGSVLLTCLMDEIADLQTLRYSYLEGLLSLYALQMDDNNVLDA